MLSCESCQQAMADVLYESHPHTANIALQEHLADCRECAGLFDELLADRASLEEAGVHSDGLDDIPERAALDDLWQRLEPSLDRVEAERYQRLSRPRMAPWAAAITAMAATLFITLGVLFPDAGVNESQAPATASVEISQELMNYLERAEVMLMQVANTESNNAAGIPVTQDFARNLATEANLLTVDGNRGFTSNQRKLLRDIEFLLMQVANLDESNMEEGVTLLQRYLEENSILFKIRLLEMRDQEPLVI